jgi:DNA-binding CsgD family transcriptional regulator
VLVAVDDLHWLDAQSADALAYAARRLGDEGVAWLATGRPGGATALERAFPRERIQRLEVGPLSLGALRRLLSVRLGLSLPRYTLRRLVELTLGNPLFALEVGRTLAEQGGRAPGGDLPVPDAVESLLGTRVARLTAPSRRLLLALALSADLRVAELRRLVGADAVADAVDAGLVVVDGDRVRAAHPLIAAAARKRAGERERRDLHRRLGRIVADAELRARHLALAAVRPNAGLAAELTATAASARSRGALETAIELGEQALRLTPPDAPERGERLLALADHLDVAGDSELVTALLGPEVENLPQGPLRARAHLLLASDASRAGEVERQLELAHLESEADPELRATVLAVRASDVAVGRVERIRECEAWTNEALSLIRAAGREVDPTVAEALGWIALLRGRPLPTVVEAGGSTRVGQEIYRSLERVAAIRLAFRGEVAEARARFAELLRLADERGEEWSVASMRLQLCELELRCGRWAVAERLLEEWDVSPGITFAASRLRCRALLAAGRGLPGEAERLAAEAIAADEAAEVRWSLLESLRARGIAALLAHEPDRAVESLRAVWEHTRRQGIDEPGAFPVAPDLVEALVEAGELDEARAVTTRLRELAERQEHPWGLVTARRCDALLRLASTRDEGAAAALADAAAAYARLGLGFDRARALLCLGRLLRRGRRWAKARAALGEAVAAFEELPSPGWVEAARSELARVSARRPHPAGELTEAEGRVVELAASGMSNKEIARALVVTVSTVEAHLSKAYAKLGVRSRAQLAARLAARP